MSNPLNLTRILKGKLSVHYMPHFNWLYVRFCRYWSDRLFYLTIGRVNFILDCRENVLLDMMTGQIDNGVDDE